MGRVALVLGLVALLALGCGASVSAGDLQKLTPLELLQLLKRGQPDQVFTVQAAVNGWVKEEHVPALIKLLDSSEACMPVVLAKSSTLPGRSTIGQEAAFMVEGFRTGYYPPALFAAHTSVGTSKQLVEWWAARCPSVDSIKLLPFHGERGIDYAYDTLRFDEYCQSVLIEALDDLRPMPDPRQMPHDERFAVADAALFTLLDRLSLQIEDVLPREAAARLENDGVRAYFDYVAIPAGRQAVVEEAKRRAAAVSLTAAGVETFDARVQRAKALEETPLGRAYQDSMWPLVQPFMASLLKKCISNDAQADLTSFVWVGTLTVEGKLDAVAVQPITATSQCFSRGMQQAPFPKLTKEWAHDGMPLTFNMRLHPMKH
jgi:hypothetical protein